MLKKPYLGVTGIMSAEQANSLVRSLISPDYHLMAGILVSHRSLSGRPVQPRVVHRYPNQSHIGTILRGIHDNRILKLIHYSNGGTPEAFGDDLAAMHSLWGTDPGGIDGFQFNMVWPNLSVLEAYRAGVGHDKTLVLQIGSRAMEKVGNSPERLLELIGKYPPGLFDAVLLDPSSGNGEPFIPLDIAGFTNEILESDLPLSLVVAGGLGPNSMGHLRHLKTLVVGGPLSIDAEDALMVEGGRLNLVRAHDYMVEAQHILIS